MNNPDHISESFETIVWVKILNFFYVDPGWKKFIFGMETILIRDKHPGSGTLHTDMRQNKDDVPGCGRAALAAFPSGWAASAPDCSSPLRALRVVTHTSHSHPANLREKSVCL
jgi:hypothetical protein